MTIYIDVLVMINAFVTYFLLLSTQTFLGSRTGNRRFILACGIGGVYSLVILLSGVSAIVLTAAKVVVSVIIVFVAFGKMPWKLFAKSLIFFYLVNFIYAGFMFALWYFVSPIGMIYKNGVVYFNVSALLLCVSTVAAFLVIQVVHYLINKNIDCKNLVDLEIEADNKEVFLQGFVDTGNHLIDITTGYPVAVCMINSLEPLFAPEILENVKTLSLDKITNQYWQKRLRIIPVGAATGDSLMVAFKPDGFWTIENEYKKSRAAVVGISLQEMSDGQFSALVSKELTG